jgi:hypothetical protein
MRNNLKNLRREKKMYELEEMTLPLVVLIKLVGEEEARTYTHYFQDRRGVEELPLELQDVVIKTVSVEEYNREYMFHSAWKRLRRDTEMIWEGTPDVISDRVGTEIGTVVIGAYKKLLDMYSELFEEKLMEFREEYSLDNEEWSEIEAEIRQMMERDVHPQLISNYIIDHILSKTEEGEERLTKIWESGEYNPLTKEEIEYYHKLAQEKQFK